MFELAFELFIVQNPRNMSLRKDEKLMKRLLEIYEEYYIEELQSERYNDVSNMRERERN